MNPIRIGALISGGGTNLQAVIDACNAKKIDGTIVFVGSDNPNAKGLERARKHSIPTFVVDYASIIREVKSTPERHPIPPDVDLEQISAKQSLIPAGADMQHRQRFLISRVIAESKLLEHIQSYPFDLLILAGFMRNLTPYFIDRINTDPDNPRIMNIHPALLPSFPGVDGYGDTFRYGCKVGGCTVHFIDYGEDSGPIIGQKAFPIEETDTLDTVRQKGLQLEWQLYPECIQLFAEKRLQIMRMTYPMEKGNPMQRTIVKILDKSSS